jgi:glutaminase
VTRRRCEKFDTRGIKGADHHRVMKDRRSRSPYVSTGHLAPPDQVKPLAAEAHQRYKTNTDGQNSQVNPALARVPSKPFGICIVGTSGNVCTVGDAEYEFTIMSVSKPFIFVLVCEALLCGPTVKHVISK